MNPEEIKEFELRIKDGIERHIEHALFSCCSIKEVRASTDYAFHIPNMLGVRLVSEIRGIDFGRAIIRYPASPWQAFKKKWMPWLGVKYAAKSWIIFKAKDEGFGLIPSGENVD